MAGDLTARIREAYLAHRLNHSELVRVAQAAPERKEALLAEYRDPHQDTRETYTPAQLGEAWSSLGLQQDFANLKSDQVWSPEQRALYRRLALPENDQCVHVESEPVPGAGGFVETAQRHFDGWDSDGDTRLGARELDRAMGAPASPEEAATLALLRGRQGSLGAAYPGDGEGISQRDLTTVAREGLPGNPKGTRDLLEDFDELTARARDFQPLGPVEEEDKDPQAVWQGRQGACVMLSTAAGLEPEALQEMFQTDEMGVRVNFADGDYEIVSDLFPAELLYHARTDSGGRWPGLLETAMGQRLYRQNHPEDGSVRTAGDGVPVQEAFLALTGQGAVEHSLNELTPDQTRELLQKVTQDPGPDICGTRSDPILRDPLDCDVEELHNGIPNSHAYTILGYDPKTDEVTLRNPWHRQVWVNAKDDGSGIFNLPLEQFYSSFRWVASAA